MKCRSILVALLCLLTVTSLSGADKWSQFTSEHTREVLIPAGIIVSALEEGNFERILPILHPFEIHVNGRTWMPLQEFTDMLKKIRQQMTPGTPGFGTPATFTIDDLESNQQVKNSVQGMFPLLDNRSLLVTVPESGGDALKMVFSRDREQEIWLLTAFSWKETDMPPSSRTSPAIPGSWPEYTIPGLKRTIALPAACKVFFCRDSRDFFQRSRKIPAKAEALFAVIDYSGALNEFTRQWLRVMFDSPDQSNLRVRFIRLGYRFDIPETEIRGKKIIRTLGFVNCADRLLVILLSRPESSDINSGISIENMLGQLKN